jgi:hypothetical protein
MASNSSSSSSSSYSAQGAVDALTATPYGEHILLVYPDVGTLRKIYCEFAKLEIRENNIVLLFPFYETTDSVRLALFNDGIGIEKYEDSLSIMIIQAMRAFFESGIDFASFLQMTAASALKYGKSGVAVLADLGPFFLTEKERELVEYEKGLKSKLGDRVKKVCAYNAGNYKMLTEVERHVLHKHHEKVVIVEEPPGGIKGAAVGGGGDAGGRGGAGGK